MIGAMQEPALLTRPGNPAGGIPLSKPFEYPPRPDEMESPQEMTPEEHVRQLWMVLGLGE